MAKKPERIVLTSYNVTIKKGSNFKTIRYQVYPTSASQKVRWESDNTSIATVSASGSSCKIHGIKEGSTKVRCISEVDGSIKATCTVKVTFVNVERIVIVPSMTGLKQKEKKTFKATVFPKTATNKTVYWESSSPSDVRISKYTGEAECLGVSDGSIINIYATSESNPQVCQICEVTLKTYRPVKEIFLIPSSVKIAKGEGLQLMHSFNPDNPTYVDVTYKSENPQIATVDKFGYVKARKVGKTRIVITTTKEKVNGYATIIVKKGAVPEQESAKNSAKESKVQDPVDAFSGAHLLEHNLMSLFCGRDVHLSAKYNSMNICKGSIGTGWYLNIDKRIEHNEYACSMKLYETPSEFNVFEGEYGSTVYHCTNPARGYYIITDNGTCGGGVRYTVNNNYEVFEYYDRFGVLLSFEDKNGFETRINRSGNTITITDVLTNRKIFLEKNGDGLVTKIYDDNNRQVILSYSGTFLTSIRDVNGNTISYTYDEDGRVLTGTDANGVKFFEDTYDECGRVISQKDAISGSSPSQFEYTDELVRTLTDRNGKKSTRTFSLKGLLTELIDENGSRKFFAYDSNNNMILEQDQNGKAVCKDYNAYNKLTDIYDRNSNHTHISYDYKFNITRIDYPEVDGKKPFETFRYNSRNQLVCHTDLRGTQTLYTYNLSGLPVSKKVGNKNAELYTYENGLIKTKTSSAGVVTTYTYNALGQMISETTDNKTTSYQYDLSGNLLKTTDPIGNIKTIAYDKNYQKISETDANGNVTRYEYNGNLKNTAVITPDNNRTTIAYDGEDRKIKITDQAGNISKIGYDPAGRVISKTDALNNSVTYELDGVGNIIKETNALGAAVIKEYDNNGNVIKITQPDGNSEIYQYDAMNRKIRSVNTVMGTTLYEYSPAGDLLSETDPLGNKKSNTYDIYGNKLSQTDAMGNTTTYTYDSENRLLTETDPLGNMISNTYDVLGRLVSVTDKRNNTSLFGYDACGRRTTVTDPKGNTFTTVYDANGNVLKTLDAKSKTITQTVYNSLNLPITVHEQSGDIKTMTYNSLGKVACISDALNNTKQFSYDALGRNNTVKDALNNTSGIVFDNIGNILKLYGPAGAATDYTYDSLGRLLTETTSSGSTVSYTYNELNLKKEFTNARGNKRKFFYDAAGRITGYESKEDRVSYTYDKNGNILSVTDSHGSIKREFDALNRVVSCTDTAGRKISYSYDQSGNLITLTYPDNTTVSYAYDANNNLISVTDWANRVTTYTYDVNNKLISETKSNGSITTYSYDDKQRLISYSAKTAFEDLIEGYEFRYDSIGNISTEKTLAEEKDLCYTYDKLSRVTSRTVKNSCNNPIGAESYSYDAAGNILSDSLGTFVYDVNNRLSSYKGYTAYYDADGNMTGFPNMELSGCEYDSSNRLIKMDDREYTYNAEDVRLTSSYLDEKTEYCYDTLPKLSRLLFKKTGNKITKYIYGLGLIAEETGDEYNVYHFDLRGSTIALTSKWGCVKDKFIYDTYGRLLNSYDNSNVIFKFCGKDGVITEPNGLLYMRARYYSPILRRFINSDVVAGEISDSVTLNRYAYANGNPVSNTDPFGLSAERNNNLSSLEEEILKFKNFIIDMDYYSYGRLKDLFATKFATKVGEKTFMDIYRKLIRKNNKANDIKNEVINDQSSENVRLKNIHYGYFSMVNNGCEIIAINNALVLSGKDSSIADLVDKFVSKDSYFLINHFFLKGLFGAQPKAMGDALNMVGLKNKKAELNDVNKKGIYIVSYWDGTSIFDPIHTIAVRNDGKGNIAAYNNSSYGVTTRFDVSKYKNTFISGFKII